MIRVIVLIKQVPDPKVRARLKEDGTVDRERVRAVMNPYDRNALEEALRLKEVIGAKVIAISMGPLKAESVLREALAMGADEAILLSDPMLAGSDTLATSYALSKVIKMLGNYDLILCGMETTDGNTGQVGPEVAEHLGIPHVTYVEDFELRNGYLLVKRLIEGGYQWLKVRLPALLTITNTANEPRCSTFEGVIRALKKNVRRLSLEETGIEKGRVGLIGSPTRIKEVRRVNLRRRRYIIRKPSAKEAVEELLRELSSKGIKLVMNGG
ncbi:MAG: electron transfer flavoprotein subunit beta [Thermofilum sp. ex4484_15]|nr:MAG: electron transfer flavoprotein subunit beta [Thermofilum sp. ex4484_15]